MSDYTPEEWKQGYLLMLQENGMMASGDRTGRYYAENELGQYNPQRIRSARRGITSGGHWYGVKSMRTMLPWFGTTNFTPSELRAALKGRWSRRRSNQVWRSATAFIRSERLRR